MGVTTARSSSVNTGTRFANFEANNVSALVPIASQTLGSTATSVSFSNIPQTFQDLRLVIVTATATGTNNITFSLNSDTASNYSFTYILGTGSSAASSRGSSLTLGYLGGVAQAQTVTVMNILSYANTSTNKTVLNRNDSPDYYTSAWVNLWRNTAAVTAISVGVTSSAFASGSTFNLYGVRSA